MKSKIKLSKVLFVLYLVLQVGIGIFLSNMFILPRLANAWLYDRSATAECILIASENKNNVHIKVSFKNKQVGTPASNTVNGKSMNVVAKDSWSGKEVNLGSIAVEETKEGLINTGQTSMATGSTVTFTMTWTDGSFAGEDSLGIHNETVSYSALTCDQPTLPTPTVVPTAVPTPTSVPPTATPTPIPAPVSATPTPTPIAVAATPTPTPVPAGPTPTPIVVSVVVQGVSVGPTSTPTPAPPQVQVLAAATVRQLPKTGAADGILFGLLSLLPVGFILRNKAKNMFS